MNNIVDVNDRILSKHARSRRAMLIRIFSAVSTSNVVRTNRVALPRTPCRFDFCIDWFLTVDLQLRKYEFCAGRPPRRCTHFISLAIIISSFTTTKQRKKHNIKITKYMQQTRCNRKIILQLSHKTSTEYFHLLF